MTYYFNHPDYTSGQVEDIGGNEVEAMATLQRDYQLELEVIFDLANSEHIWEASQ